MAQRISIVDYGMGNLRSVQKACAHVAPAARIVNLETSITTSEHAEPKLINYRMHPANVGVLSAAGIDCATLANNHVLDWGRDGLRDTLDALASGSEERRVGKECRTVCRSRWSPYH